MPIELPKPIADYVAANARLDTDAMLKPFAADAAFLDNGKRFEGHDQIRNLFEEEVIAVKAIFTPDAIRREDGLRLMNGFTYRGEMSFSECPNRCSSRAQ
ncbi:Cif family virulence factor [Novosphingobium lindaniclasticum]|uniref:SnoaL-like domain-containing protein n=1 Tax=Novosphingobium lindaniclasticum LE124 TaxID=1096930 RepID=T0J332_9SPHN|nr:nuclear transport factor 2 family protein [Novosphingobium lindaniclasticum]EQB16339.1 hypothetical protein L284_09490 [Novosphingobium lindaniclasticum LE124]